MVKRTARLVQIKCNNHSHALRHTHASILLLKGVSLAYISKRLGHKDITMTANTYSHVLKELEAQSEKESADMFYGMYS
ncbi:tyrosine-type recombinase/integrase [Ruoffia tabacinasalis]|uniref:tyrosine-type recombinase/integrase n=1 Tax=Ruoffia tabacinasalis TaxID=87458 RepID=UPI003F9A254D